MKVNYSRRAFLRISAQLGLGLGASSMAACNRIPGNISQATSLIPPLKAGDYKALVCVFLNGGNDAYNLMVPTTLEKYDLYARARLDLAVPKSQLLALEGRAADGAAYGLHPACPDLQRLFNNGNAALLSNVGSLAAPTSKADFKADRVPPHLFSHNDQQDQWQTAHADVNDASGWAGRIADVLSGSNGDATLPLNITLSGSNLLQTGLNRFAFGMSAAGVSRLNDLDPNGGNAALRVTFDRIRKLDAQHVFERRYASSLGNGIDLNALLEQALKSAPELITQFPTGSNLARQLLMVAKLISVRSALGMKRQIFYVTLGGFDTHDAQSSSHPALLQQLSESLSAFQNAMSELGTQDAVTTFTASDFGRSLTINGKGTDHGWSSHHLIAGGAVRGGRIYGTPPSLVVEGPDDTRGGRFIPSTSVDEYGATLASWFGVADSDLGYVFPNLGRFATRNLGFV